MRTERLREWVHSHREFFIELVRVYLGVSLCIRGLFFLMNPEMLAVNARSGWLQGSVGVVPYVHILGGSLLALGFLARIAALVQIPILFIATFVINIPRMNGVAQRESIEFSALVLFLLAIFAIRGARGLSIVQYWRSGRPEPRGPYQEWIHAHPDVFMDLIRAYLGIGLFLKGLFILNNRAEFLQAVQASVGDMPFGLLLAAHYVIPAHFAGGAMLLFGLGTRVAALAQIPLLIGAVFYVYLPRFATLELRENLEFSALVLFLLGVITVHGPGRFSVDYWARKKEERELLHFEPAHSS
jgi:putative oxidoreductase